MRCILFNKTTPIFEIEYNSNSNHIDEIYTIYNIDYAPLRVYTAFHNKKSGNILTATNDWFEHRGIPSWRENLMHLLEQLGIDESKELINKSYGLSLSDQYWFKEKDSSIQWSDINFFTNDFEFSAFSQASLDTSRSKIINIDSQSLTIPDGTTDGALKKAWIIEDGIRKLAKTGTGISGEEPFNEWLASEICNQLGFDHAVNELGVLHNQLVSKSIDFIDGNMELVTANDILCTEKKPNNISDFEFFINILNQNGITNAKTELSKMFALDCFMMNEDRHTRNFGIIRDVNTLRWIKLAPIYDTGYAMQANRNRLNTNFENGTGKFFNNTSKPYEDVFKIISSTASLYDWNALVNLVTLYQTQLEKYKDVTNMSSDRINALVGGLRHRITWMNQQIKKL